MPPREEPEARGYTGPLVRKKRMNRTKYGNSDSYSSNSENSAQDSDSDSEYEARRSRAKRMKPVNDAFKRVSVYKIYLFHDNSSRYTKIVAKNVSKGGKRISSEMRGHTFDRNDPISVLGFLSRFQTACNQNGVSERAAICCSHLFITRAALMGLQSRIGGESGTQKRRGKES